MTNTFSNVTNSLINYLKNPFSSVDVFFKETNNSGLFPFGKLFLNKWEGLSKIKLPLVKLLNTSKLNLRLSDIAVLFVALFFGLRTFFDRLVLDFDFITLNIIFFCLFTTPIYFIDGRFLGDVNAFNKASNILFFTIIFYLYVKIEELFE